MIAMSTYPSLPQEGGIGPPRIAWENASICGPNSSTKSGNTGRSRSADHPIHYLAEPAHQIQPKCGVTGPGGKGRWSPMCAAIGGKDCGPSRLHGADGNQRVAANAGDEVRVGMQGRAIVAQHGRPFCEPLSDRMSGIHSFRHHSLRVLTAVVV